MKTEPYKKHWEEKWDNFLGVPKHEWKNIWESIFYSYRDFHIQDSLWELIHLIFFSSHKQHKYKYTDNEECNLCGLSEVNRSH